MVGGGGRETLDEFFEYINSIWGELKFTMTADEQRVSYLDTMVIKMEDGTIQTDIYRNSILHFKSGHPESVKRAIPKSQFDRIRRIVSDPMTQTLRLREMEERFTSRGYPHSVLHEAQRTNEVVTSVGMQENSNKKEKNKKRIPFVRNHHPLNNKVDRIIKKH